MNDHFVLDENGNPVVTDFMTWARWFEYGNRDVAKTTVGPVDVSTVFLGLNQNFDDDGPPLIYETLAFVRNDDGSRTSIENSMRRYSTRQEAEAGHQEIVQFIHDALHSLPEGVSASALIEI